MRFTWNETGDRVYEGPATTDGLLGGFPLGVQRWLKRTMKVERIEQLDVVEARLAYFFLTIRQADHTLLPAEQIDDLRTIDFKLVKHKVSHPLDDDGDCGECNQPIEASVHTGDDGPLPVAADPTPPVPAAAEAGPTP